MEATSASRAQNLDTVCVLHTALPATWKQRVAEWLADDVPGFDIGGSVAGSAPVTAHLLCKSPNVVLAGLPFFDAVFEACNCTVSYRASEGNELASGTVVAVVSGRACDVLRGERTALELIVRASSVATRAQHFAKHVKSSNPQFKGRIAGTRKTTPGLRLVEKYALMVAGVDTHRMDLSQMVMLKDNHIDVVGSIPNAVAMARSRAGFSCKIEVECRSVQDALVAAEAGADVVMLDNFSPADAAAAAKQVKDAFGPRVLVEVSGGIRTEKDLEAYASECVDVISMGTLTQAVVPVDFSLKIRK